MTLRVDVEPSLLRWAVSRAGWSPETIESYSQEFDAWLRQDKRPTLKQLEKFARATHTPLGLLFLDTPPIESVPIPDMRTLGNTAIASPSGDLLDTIYLCQEHQDWYRDYARENELDPVNFVGSASISENPQVVAAQMRNDLGFDVSERTAFANYEETLRGLINRIEALGVLVKVSGVVGSNTRRQLRPEEFRGFALSDKLAPLIFVNGADTKAAQIFTLIHELAHLYLGESALSDAAMRAESDSAHEIWCNKVAAEVLVPRASLKREFTGEITAAELGRLAKKYKVSTLVILKSMFDAELVNWNSYRTHYDEELERIATRMEHRDAKGNGGNYYPTQAIRLSRRFAQAVLRSTFEGSTSHRDAYHLLGTKKNATLLRLAENLEVA